MGKTATMADVVRTNEEAFFFLVSRRPGKRFRQEMRHQRTLVMKSLEKEIGKVPITSETRLPHATHQIYLLYCLWLYRYQRQMIVRRRLTLHKVMKQLFRLRPGQVAWRRAQFAILT